MYIPPSKLYDAGKKNETFFKIIETNVRAAYQTIGDILVQVAVNDLGIRSLHRMMQETGLTAIDGLGSQIIAASETAMRAAIKAAPNGTYKAEYRADGDGIQEPVTMAWVAGIIRLRVQVNEKVFENTFHASFVLVTKFPDQAEASQIPPPAGGGGGLGISNMSTYPLPIPTLMELATG